MRVAALLLLVLASCSRPSPSASASASPSASASASASPSASPSASAFSLTPPLPPTATPCTTPSGPPCTRFATNEDAFRWLLAQDPAILAIGEAHAQKGTEAVTSATKRFTDSMVSLLENRASDLLVEAWAPDPRCQKEVKQVASAQKPVQQAQAQSNPNEYIALGTRAKALGVQPHLLRPTCDDFASLADAGDDVVTQSLSLIKRLTQSDATKLFERNESTKNGKLVVTYGGAMHNDLAPAESLRQYSFGPELSAKTGGRYVELDLIVPEYVKATEVWQKLPWYAAFQADAGPKDKPIVYRLGERSFVLIFRKFQHPLKDVAERHVQYAYNPLRRLEHMRGDRVFIGVLVSALVAAACGGGTPAPKAPMDAGKPVAREAARACAAPGAAKGPKPLGGTRTSSTVALATSGTRTIAYVADEDAHAVQTIDVDSKMELASTPLDGAPSHVLVLPDGRVLVTVKNRARVHVLEPGDKPELPLTARCSADTAAEPLTMALTPDDKTVVVVSGWGRALTAFSSDMLVKKFDVPLAREPRAVVISDDGATAFVSHAVGSKLSVVGLEEKKETEVIMRGRDPQLAASMKMQRQNMERMRASGKLTPEMEKRVEENEVRQLTAMTRPSAQGYALAKSIDPPGRVLMPQVFIDPGDPTQRAEGYGHDGTPTESQNVAVIDEGTKQPFESSVVFARNHFFSGGADDPRDHHGACLLPRAAAVDAKTKTLLVTCFGLDDLVAFDAAAANPASAEKRRWDVGGGPTGVAVDPVKHRAIVWAQFDRSINIVSLDGPDVVDEKKNPIPDPVVFGLAPLKDKLAAEVQLGRLLFHNANDSRIAHDGRACASCHPDGRDDGITWATPLGPRRTILLAGRVGITPPYSWSGTEKTLHEHLHTTFDRLDGQGLRSLELDAIVAYITTLAPPNEGAVLVQAPDATKLAHGKEIFTSSEAQCSSCHIPSAGYSDGLLHDVKSKTTADKNAEFNTPSLKGVGGTGPWFHDGRYATLKELFKGVDGKMGKTKHLNDADLDALETYVRTL